LYGLVDDVYGVARDGAGTAVADGSLLSGELLSAWRDFEQSGDLIGLFERKRFRRRITDGFSGRNQRGTDLLATAGGAVLALAVVQAESAAETVTHTWRGLDAGAALLGPTRGLDRPSHDLRDRLHRVVADWQSGLVAAIQRVAESNRRLDTIASQQLDGLTAVLAGVALDNLGSVGVTARGRAALEAVMGPGRVAEIVTGARTRLVADIAEVLVAEKQRFLDLLESPETVRAAHDSLRDAARRADYARHSEALDEEMA
jgi:hypothetical protein